MRGPSNDRNVRKLRTRNDFYLRHHIGAQDVMSRPRPRTNSFILEAFDRDLWCAALQARFCVADRDSLRSALGKVAENDPELEDCYYVGKKQRQSEGSSVLSWTKIIWDPAILLYGSSDSVGYLKRHI